MSTYILLLTLTQEGRDRMVQDPYALLRAEDEIEVDDVHCFGLYGVLGDFDFVTLVEAPDNESAARFSLELGAKAGAHIQTLPAVPIALLSQRSREERNDIPDAVPEPNGGSLAP
ncbi:MAG: GYD domain-containing protein [Dehalococcoidia bacterium]|nr:GYD domain-containing protein [Dehalococcoidia bacterium]